MWTINCLGVWNRYLTERVKWARHFTNAVLEADYEGTSCHSAMALWSSDQNHAWAHPPKCLFLKPFPTTSKNAASCLSLRFSSVWGTQKILRKWKLGSPHTMWLFCWWKGKVTESLMFRIQTRMETHKQSKQKEIRGRAMDIAQRLSALRVSRPRHSRSSLYRTNSKSHIAWSSIHCS